MVSAASIENAENTEGRASQPEVERDASFYFDDDLMAIFLVGHNVENKLFRVHRRYFIKMSQIFRDMFSTANTGGGQTDDEPILLSGVTEHEFETLLKFFYSLPPHVLGDSPIVFPATTKFTLEEKLSLLSISHRFHFDDIFRFILQQVESASVPVAERIRLSDEYNIPEWLSSAYTALLNRSPGELSAEEVEVLGPERVAYHYKAKCSMHRAQLTKKDSNLKWLIGLIAFLVAACLGRA